MSEDEKICIKRDFFFLITEPLICFPSEKKKTMALEYFYWTASYSKLDPSNLKVSRL